jgi:four helix bundle protein
MGNGAYQEKLRGLSDAYAHDVYRLSKSFPKEEIYGVTSQLRRASLSVVLNCVEGYTRKGERDFRRFIEIAFGSLKESRYLIDFSVKEGFLQEKQATDAIRLGDEIGAMLWGILRKKPQMFND